MIVVRFKAKCKPEKTEQAAAAFEAVVAPSRAVEGVVSFDIGRTSPIPTPSSPPRCSQIGRLSRGRSRCPWCRKRSVCFLSSWRPNPKRLSSTSPHPSRGGTEPVEYA